MLDYARLIFFLQTLVKMPMHKNNFRNNFSPLSITYSDPPTYTIYYITVRLLCLLPEPIVVLLLYIREMQEMIPGIPVSLQLFRQKLNEKNWNAYISTSVRNQKIILASIEQLQKLYWFSKLGGWGSKIKSVTPILVLMYI